MEEAEKCQMVIQQLFYSEGTVSPQEENRLTVNRLRLLAIQLETLSVRVAGSDVVTDLHHKVLPLPLFCCSLCLCCSLSLLLSVSVALSLCCSISLWLS